MYSFDPVEDLPIVILIYRELYKFAAISFPTTGTNIDPRLSQLCNFAYATIAQLSIHVQKMLEKNNDNFFRIWVQEQPMLPKVVGETNFDISH